MGQRQVKKARKQSATRPMRKSAANVPRKRILKNPEAKKPSRTEGEISNGRQAAAVLLAVAGIFVALALYSHISSLAPDQAHLGAKPGALRSENMMGVVGQSIAAFLFHFLGWCSFAAVVWALLLSRSVWADQSPERASSVKSPLVTVLASVMMAAACASIAAILFGERGGGAIGSAAAAQLVRYLNKPGALLLSSACLLLSFGSATGFGALDLAKAVKRVFETLQMLFADAWYVCSTFIVAIVTGAGRLIKSAATLSASAAKAAVSSLPSRTKERDSETKPLKRPAVRELTPLVDDAEGDDEADFSAAAPEPDRSEDLVEPIISRRQTAFEFAAAEAAAKGSKKTAADGKKAAAKAVEPEPRAAYQPPPLELLVSSDGIVSLGPEDDDLIENSRCLEVALQNFRIGGRVTEVHPGPVVTLYEFEPAAGIKVQRVINLADDLALALKVSGVRVYAPVPGKGTVGIEVPNAQREIVRLRDVLESKEYQQREFALPLAMGKTTFGEPFLADLSKMPHLLIAGATGTGKSVCINSLLLSLLYRNTPDLLRLILIDPKMLELSIYEDIPHLMAPVVTIPKRARGVLWWAAEEMDRRYRLMKEMSVRDISMYNRAVGAGVDESERAQRRGKRKQNEVIRLEEQDVIATGSPYEGLDRTTNSRDELLRIRGADEEHRPLPRIVIVVDELADLMLTVGREIEELLTRLAQKARASGIHLILATQRPSVNVITGLIKANFPARVSFKVASKIDARTILDTSGAEKLLGQGDMLFLSPGVGRIKRLHSPFVSDKEVNDVADWLKDQGKPQYDVEVERMIARAEETSSASGEGSAAGGEEEYDEFYDQAVQLVVERGQASTSMVQRAFRIGYNRAARILEIMERDGVVGPADGARPRQVLLGSSDDLI